MANNDIVTWLRKSKQMERLLRKWVIESENSAIEMDTKTMLGAVGKFGVGPDKEDVVFTEEQFVMAELLGHKPEEVGVAVILRFLVNIGALKIRPNLFIHQWAAWRASKVSHSCVKRE